MGGETTSEAREPFINQSVIDGSTSLDGAKAACVVFLEVNTTIDGFRVRGGHARELAPGQSSVGRSGGGICTIFNPSLTEISRCIFENSGADSAGGGLNLGGVTVVRECIFLANWARAGGGAVTGPGEYYDCLFESNVCQGDPEVPELGSGGASASTGGLFYRCVFKNNRARVGGALSLRESGAAYNCLFVGNEATEAGGAVQLIGEWYQPVGGEGWWYSGQALLNCTFAGNTAPAGPTGTLSTRLSLRNCILPGPIAEEFSYGSSTVFESTAGTYTGDPHFAEPAAGDYRLLPDSPAIDAGSDEGYSDYLISLLTPDLAGTKRPVGADYDAGAYEYDPSGDSDGYGILNQTEWDTYGTDLYDADTDGDFLEDGDELNDYGTLPTNPDTDGDGATDGQEISAGTDPLNPNDTPIIPLAPWALGAALLGACIALRNGRAGIVR